MALIYPSSSAQDYLALLGISGFPSWSVDGPGTSGFFFSLTFLLHHSSLAQDYLDFQVVWISFADLGTGWLSVDGQLMSFHLCHSSFEMAT